MHRVAGLFAAAGVALLAAACSRDEGRPAEVHETGAPPPMAVAPVPTGPVDGVSAEGAAVIIDGDHLFQPQTTELSSDAEMMLRRAAEMIGPGDGPMILVSGHGSDRIEADALAKSAAEALSYVGGLPFSRLQPRGVVDATPGRHIVLTTQP